MLREVYTVGDLFAGVGGIALGFKKAKMEVVWANEIDKHACITYRKNFSSHLMLEGDIHKLNEKNGIEGINYKNIPYVDIICGGFPCQAFSIAGYQKGFHDNRGNLFYEIMKLAKYVNPRVLFLENVKNLYRHDKGNTYRVIKECLEKNGYYIWDNILNTCDYSDIPQNRERLYIVAFKDKEAFDLFKPPSRVKKTRKPKELLDTYVDDAFYYTNSRYYKQLKEEMKNADSIYQWRRVYVRENKRGVCPTLTANMGTGGHNVPLIIDSKDIRKLTPRECFRFQGFPNSYKLPSNLSNSALYKQAGNSVSVPVINSIAICIRETLEKIDKKDVHRKAA